jgi:hypothetical protein
MSWRRIVLLSLVLVVALGAATWIVLQRSDAATGMVRRELQARLRPAVHLGSTELDLAAGRLTAHGLRVDDPERPGQPLLTVQRADVDVAVASGGELFGVHRVVLDGVAVEAGPRFPTAATLLAPVTEPATGAPRVPPIELRNGRLRATLRVGEAPVELADVAATLAPRDSGDSATLALRGKATLVELGASVEVDGDVDAVTGAARLALTLRDAKLTTATVARVAALLGEAPPELSTDGVLRIARLTATLPGTAATGAAGAAPQLALAAELDGVAIRAPGLPALVTAAAIELRADERDGGTATLRLRQRTDRGTIDVTAHGTGLREEPHVDVRVHGSDIAIDADVLAALQLFDTGRDVVEALRPTSGHADLELFLRDPHRSGTVAELDLSLRDVAMTFHGFGEGDDRAAFPLPLVGAKGRVRLRDDVVLLDDVHASIDPACGGGTVRMQGRVDSAQPAGEDASLEVHAENVQFSPDLRLALSALLDDDGALYDKFAPSGRTAVDVQVRPGSELPGGWQVDVKPLGAAMRWAGFPYPLGDLRGSVRVREDGATFELAGVHGDGTLVLRGFIPLSPETDETPGFSAAVDLASVRIDDDLRAAVAVIAPDLDAPWRASAPTGSLAGQVKIWRPRPEAPLLHDARLELTGVDLQLPAAPWRAADLRGQLLVQGLGNATRIDFDALRGRLEHGSPTPALLAMLGHVVFGAGAGEDLAFVVRDLELDEQLGRTLEELEALGAGTWASLRPSGRVDLVCRHRRSEGVAEPLQLSVHLLDVRSDAPILLRPAERMTGELQIAGGEVRFDDVRAIMGGAQVTGTAGRVRTRPAPDGRTEIAFTVDAQGVPIDDGVANLFSGPLRDAVLARKLLGRADVDALRLRFLIPTAGATMPFETMLGGQLRLYDLDMTLGEGADGIRVQGISGVATLADSTVDERGGELAGALRGVSLQLFGQPFESIDASFVADAEHLAVSAFTARCHGGSVRSARADAPAMHYLLPGPQAPEGRLRASLTFAQVDVYTFLDRGGWTNPPYSGLASGTLELERLDGSDVLTAAGSGTMKIERGDLGEVPLFTAIYAQLPAADRPRFDELAMTWRVADRRVVFERLDVRSNFLGGNGKGSLGFDGYLELEMQLTNLLGETADPLLMPLIEYFAKNIVSFHLHGYLRDLRAERRFFTQSAPRRLPVSPMPPARPRPTAPDF